MRVSSHDLVNRANIGVNEQRYLLELVDLANIDLRPDGVSVGRGIVRYSISVGDAVGAEIRQSPGAVGRNEFSDL